MAGECSLNLRVLLVEDEAMVGMLVERMLADLGCKVVGMASDLTGGIELAQSAAADVAVLDLNLNGALSYPIADILRKRAIPFFFSTGYAVEALPGSYLGTLVVHKPLQEAALERALRDVTGRAPE